MLNLPGVEVAEVKRGDTLVPADTLAAVSMIDAELSMLPDAPTLKHRSRVHVHAFTAECLATVLLFDSSKVSSDSNKASPARTLLVRLRLAKPVCACGVERGLM